MDDRFTLYGSFTSSSSYKPMLYLALARLPFSFRTVNLKYGRQKEAEYLAINRWGVVPTPGTIYHRLVSGPDDPKGEPPSMMARAVLLLASEPAAKVNGRVTYSQQILKEFGWIQAGVGRGIDSRGSGYSEI